MIVGRFLCWARQATPSDRAEAVSSLARAYLYSNLSAADRGEARTALTAMLDDGSALVRRALAETLAASAAAPRHIIVALAADQADIAALVLARSPLLGDGDLVDSAALGDEVVQCAIASRAELSSAVSAALAEIGSAGALMALARNPGADIAEFSLARMIERHGSDGAVREALLSRPDLPVEIAQSIASALADALGSFVTRCGWLSPERSGRMVREARDRVTVALSAGQSRDAAARLAAHLRGCGQLTPALILRAVLSGAIPFVAAAFAELSGLEARRVSAILGGRRGGSFAALFARTGMPVTLRPVFEAALPAGHGREGGGSLSGPIIAQALGACASLPSEQGARLLALLHRFEAEAARDEARLEANQLADRAALDFVLTHAPDALRDDTLSPRDRMAA